MPCVIVAADAESIVETCFVADRRQIGEIDLGYYTALENLLDRLGFQNAFAVVGALVQEHQH